MDTEKLNKWVSLLANIGVLAGIVFLGLEIRQSNRIAMASAELSIRDHYFAHNQMVVTDDRVAELLPRRFLHAECHMRHGVFHARAL